MTIGNEELCMHECFPKQLRMGTARNEIRQREDDKKRCVSTQRSKTGTKK